MNKIPLITIVKRYLKDNGYTGLKNDAYDCSCYRTEIDECLEVNCVAVKDNIKPTIEKRHLHFSYIKDGGNGEVCCQKCGFSKSPNGLNTHYYCCAIGSYGATPRVRKNARCDLFRERQVNTPFYEAEI